MARRLLLSRAAQRALGPQLDAAATAHALQLVVLEEAVDDEACSVDIAFLSRDITGRSTKHEVVEPLAGCYRVLRRSPALAWVHTHSSGTDRPIYAELMRRGVAVTTSAGANATSVAQTMLAGVLALARRLPQLFAAQLRREWAPLYPANVPPDLAGQTAVLVGWGGVAQALQPWLAMLGIKVIVARQRAAPAADGIETVRYQDLPQVLPRAQWLLLACPLSALTERLIDAHALACLPRGAMLVNAARGEIVDEAALADALASGQLGGAFLDVFAHEPLAAASPLWSAPNTIVGAHSAGQAQGNTARGEAIFLDNLSRWLRGEALRNREQPASKGM